MEPLARAIQVLRKVEEVLGHHQITAGFPLLEDFGIGGKPGFRFSHSFPSNAQSLLTWSVECTADQDVMVMVILDLSGGQGPSQCVVVLHNATTSVWGAKLESAGGGQCEIPVGFEDLPRGPRDQYTELSELGAIVRIKILARYAADKFAATPTSP